MNSFNVLKSCSNAFGANSNGFYNGQVRNLDRLVNSKDSVSTNLNADDIVLDTIAPFDNTIFSKQNLGLYKYTYHNDSLLYVNNKKPANAVKQIEASTADFSKFRQKLTYTSFNSIETIKDTIIRSMGVGNPPDSVEITKTFYYGSEGQRVLMVSQEDNVIVSKKYYVGEYEYTVYPSPAPAKEVTFISTPTGLVAANVKINDDTDFYYVLTDHLGSITQLLKSNGDTVGNAQFTYDAWGRLRDVRSTNPYLLGTAQTAKFHILDRGYCGHEHLLDHDIINMNGRIYDPVVGQFMQPDNYIQFPEDNISYNRYAYCLYNPFKYTDPSGEYRVWYDYTWLTPAEPYALGADYYDVGEEEDTRMLDDELARLNTWMSKPESIREPQARIPGIPSGGNGGGFSGDHGSSEYVGSQQSKVGIQNGQGQVVTLSQDGYQAIDYRGLPTYFSELPNPNAFLLGTASYLLDWSSNIKNSRDINGKTEFCEESFLLMKSDKLVGWEPSKFEPYWYTFNDLINHTVFNNLPFIEPQKSFYLAHSHADEYDYWRTLINPQITEEEIISSYYPSQQDYDTLRNLQNFNSNFFLVIYSKGCNGFFIITDPVVGSKKNYFVPKTKLK